jgi:phosphatidylglycerophosphate synthase
MTAVDADRLPSAADFLARKRGGGLYTEAVSQRLGAWSAVLAHRRGYAPTTLTLGNLVFGLAAAAVVIAGHGRMSTVLVGLVATLLWQLAYGLDCGDGQLARVTGRASAAGKRIDILCDVALQIALVAAVATVADRHTPEPPVWLTAAFAGTWLVNLVTSLLQQGETAQSLITSGSPVIRVVKLIRDYGAVVLGIGLVIAFVPQWAIWIMVGFTLINGLFLLASIVATAQASKQAG